MLAPGRNQGHDVEGVINKLRSAQRKRVEAWAMQLIALVLVYPLDLPQTKVTPPTGRWNARHASRPHLVPPIARRIAMIIPLAIGQCLGCKPRISPKSKSRARSIVLDTDSHWQCSEP